MYISVLVGEFRFEFIGRLASEHIYSWGFTLEKVMEDIRGEGEGGIEVWALHIAEDAVAKLPCNDAAVEIRGEVEGGENEASLADAGFEQHSKLAREVPGVDGLHDGLIVRRELCEVDALGTVGEFPPLQVLPVVSGEVSEDRVQGLDEGACGVGRLHLEPRGVPENGQEAVDDIVSVLDPIAGKEENVLAGSEEGIDGRGKARPYPSLK